MANWQSNQKQVLPSHPAPTSRTLLAYGLVGKYVFQGSGGREMHQA